jgi:redox-sensitive bicupin YhaK (pirin superfamily)
MLRFSEPYSPQMLRRGDVFAARQYPRRAFGTLSDPVLNIDWFDMSGPTFPAHPHSGFSAVTYVFADSPNGFVNRDSLGGDAVTIQPGALHWSRASGGIIHEETPITGQGPVRGLQIFINLPADRQLDPAAAFHVDASDVVTSSGDSWQSRVAVDGLAIGNDTNALPAPVRIEEVQLDAGARWVTPVPAGWGGIIIALCGDVALKDGPTLDASAAIAFAASSDTHLRLTAGESGARIALVSGAQLDQPVHSQGPFMLASPEALAGRIAAYEAGDFGKIASAPSLKTA